MTNTVPLEETKRPEEYELSTETALASYISMRSANAIAVCTAIGVTLVSLSYRVYGDRLMWRLTCEYDKALNTDEVRRSVWDLAAKGFGAFKPDLYRGDANQPNTVVAVWFTDGGRQALQGVKF